MLKKIILYFVSFSHLIQLLFLKKLFKLIEDPSTIDQFIIDFIQRLVYTNEEARGCFQFCEYGSDNSSLLHFAAKQCRPFLCEYLMDELLIDKNIKTNSKMTPLHYLIKHNAFERNVQENEMMIDVAEDTNEFEEKTKKDLKKDKLQKTESVNKDERTYNERMRINVNVKNTVNFI